MCVCVCTLCAIYLCDSSHVGLQAGQGGQAGDTGNVDGMDEVELEGEEKAPVPVLSAFRGCATPHHTHSQCRCAV